MSSYQGIPYTLLVVVVVPEDFQCSRALRALFGPSDVQRDLLVTVVARDSVIVRAIGEVFAYAAKIEAIPSLPVARRAQEIQIWRHIKPPASAFILHLYVGCDARLLFRRPGVWRKAHGGVISSAPVTRDLTLTLGVNNTPARRATPLIRLKHVLVLRRRTLLLSICASIHRIELWGAGLLPHDRGIVHIIRTKTPRWCRNDQCVLGNRRARPHRNNIPDKVFASLIFRMTTYGRKRGTLSTPAILRQGRYSGH